MHAYEKREKEHHYIHYTIILSPLHVFRYLAFQYVTFVFLLHWSITRYTWNIHKNLILIKRFINVFCRKQCRYKVFCTIAHYMVPFALTILVAQVSQSSALRCARTQRKLRETELLLWQRLSCGICCHCLFLSYFLKSVLNYFLLFIYLFLYFSSVLNDKHFTHHSLNTKHFINKNDIL